MTMRLSAAGTGPAIRISLPQARRLVRGAVLAAVLSGALAGCSWFSKKPPPPLPGKRISVLQLDNTLKPDTKLADVVVHVPTPVTNSSWPQAGGYPDHAMGNPGLPDAIHQVWTADIGSGTGGGLALLSRPVIADGRIYTVDADDQLTALNPKDGSRLWRVDLRPKKRGGDAVGGGVGYDNGGLYAATGYAEVLRLDPKTGAIVWRQRIASPVRGAPTIINGHVLVLTIDNQLIALSAKDGSTEWTHTGILENAELLGAVSPAADQDVVIAPYSSGEVFALTLANGRVAWSDNLSSVRPIGALSALADIRALPVIDRGIVYVVDQGGRTVAIDERSGGRIWNQLFGGVQTPWTAGGFVFILTGTDELTAVARDTGRIRWVTPLAQYSDPKNKSGFIVWAGPVMAGGRLWLVNSQSQLLEVSPTTGKVLSTQSLPGPALLAPVVADNTLYVLTDGGQLVAYR